MCEVDILAGLNSCEQTGAGAHVERIPADVRHFKTTLGEACTPLRKLRKPRLFADVLAALLATGGPDRILYGSGVNLIHPRPLLESFAAFEMPDDLPALTAETKAAILGGNALRLHGLTTDDVISKTSGDEFDVARRSGLAAPWSGVRA